MIWLKSCRAPHVSTRDQWYDPILKLTWEDEVTLKENYGHVLLMEEVEALRDMYDNGESA